MAPVRDRWNCHVIKYYAINQFFITLIGIYKCSKKEVKTTSLNFKSSLPVSSIPEIFTRYSRLNSNDSFTSQIYPEHLLNPAPSTLLPKFSRPGRLTQYLEKKGNEIHITSKGKQLLELVPEDLKKAELTADWEKKLTAISKGKQNDQKFMREISDYTQALINDIKTSDGKFRHDNVTRHRCPECGKFLLEACG